MVCTRNTLLSLNKMLNGKDKGNPSSLKSVSWFEFDFHYYIFFRASLVLKAQPLNDPSSRFKHKIARSANNCHTRVCVTVTVLSISFDVGLMLFGLAPSDKLCPP